MKIKSWNVNGIRAVAKKGFMQAFQYVIFKPFNICLDNVYAADALRGKITIPFNHL